MSDDALRFLVVEGTVREGRASIHAAREVTDRLDRGHDAELFDPAERDIPMLHTRTYTEGEPPEDVQAFREKVLAADCIIIVTPEYNHSYPGVLKNLLDHLYPEYEDKPFAYVTVSGGPFGGVRVQEDLHRLTAVFGGHIGPSLPVLRVDSVFEDGELVDKDYEERFREFVAETVEHARRFAD